MEEEKVLEKPRGNVGLLRFAAEKWKRMAEVK
jgi:hypothetical protein